MNKYVGYLSNTCKNCDEPLYSGNCICCNITEFISKEYLHIFLKEFIKEL